MSDTRDPQAALYMALAKFQAELPAIATNHEVKTEKYKYEYADLATVSQTVLPLLGKHGLAFLSRPTVSDGKFVLSYKLVHEQGGSESGEYPLPGGQSPQNTGSAITYARRYCLYAVTGVFPSGEDDDGAQAEQGYRHSVGEPPRGREQQRGSVTRPQNGSQPAAQDGDEPDWGAAVAAVVTGEDAERVEAGIKAAFDAGRLKPVKADALRKALKAKTSKLAGAGASS